MRPPLVEDASGPPRQLGPRQRDRNTLEQYLAEPGWLGETGAGHERIGSYPHHGRGHIGTRVIYCLEPLPRPCRVDAAVGQHTREVAIRGGSAWHQVAV